MAPGASGAPAMVAAAVAVALWILVPLVVLHLALLGRRRELLRFQLLLDVVLAVVVGPALLVGGDLGTVRALERNAPYDRWEFSDATGFQPTQSDLVLQIHPWMEESRRQLLEGRLPLVAEHIGAGMPLLAHGQSGLWAPVNLPVWVLGPARGTTVMAAYKLELAGLGAFLLLRRRWRLPGGAATVGGIGWAAAPYFLSWLLVPMGWVIAALPWVWWLVLRVAGGRARAGRVVAAGVLLGWLLGSGLNPETAVIVVGSALLAAVVLHPRRWARVLAVAALAGVVAAALAWPTFGSISASSRIAVESEEAGNRAPAPLELRRDAAMQLVAPAVHGHPGRDDWRAPYPHAGGAMGVGGAVLGLLAAASVRRRRRRLACAAVAQLAVVAVLVFRVPPLDALLVRVPPLDVMTLPRFAVLAPWGLLLLAALAVEGARAGRGRRGVVPWLPAAVVAVVAVLGSAWTLAPADLLLVLLGVVLAAAAPLVAGRPGWPGLLVGGELVLLGIGINPVVHPSDRLPRPEPVVRLQAAVAAEGGRVLGLHGWLPPNMASLHGLTDLNAYDPVRPLPYAAMMGRLGDHDPILGGAVSEAPPRLLGAWSVRWLLGPATARPPGWQEFWRDGSTSLWRNPAWLPELRVHGEVVEGDLALLTSETLDLSRVAVVPPGSPAVEAESVRLDLVTVQPTRVRASVECDGPCLVLLARPWSPGWFASVDGRPAELVLANLAGLGVVSPAGRHEVELRYRPWRWAWAHRPDAPAHLFAFQPLR